MDIQVLVTGAGGFIGSHLTEELVRTGYQVRALVHYNFQNNWGWLETLPEEVMKNVEVYPADICDPFAVRKAVVGCDMVYHLAALIAIPYSYIAPASYVEVNVKGTLNVLQACKEEGVRRMVHTSTSEVYGTAQYTPIDEGHPLVGQSPYSASKIAADKLVESYFLSFDLPVATIRPFNTFGPRQSGRAVIPTLIAQALSGAEVISLGSLNPVRDFNYVKDTVFAYRAIAACDAAIGKVINIGPGKGISVGDLVSAILGICDSSARIVCDERRIRPEKSEVFKLICDSERAKEILQWEPQYSLRQGLEETVRWMRENLSRYKPRIYNV
ncbi:SDR family NAD(P)-dependent oxidoreductase [Nitrosococcus watsonii]|uniref:NAD-dependent epimerase/dehydratase n=1 Tax=Nitrosococcus watsoni (strain C-113) TaxID=105559 RepID=D8KBF3_NITWC|nr:SDR family NAD(P)-dependent oxidoreductase [Nitrosococcus watsonii]ADJ29600.1 NAD-dependent epimerase/dehydratase [Nitrosococcus watsonii C-113]